jgi:hypothetical protein
VSLVYLLFAMSVLFGSSAWFAISTDRAAGMTILAIFSTFGFYFL